MDDRELLGRIAEKVGKIDVLIEAQKRLEENHARMETAIGKMADAVTKLAVIEERQQASSTAIERLAEEQKKLDERMRALEVAEPMQVQTAEWVRSAVWAAASAAVMFAAGKLGLF